MRKGIIKRTIALLIILAVTVLYLPNYSVRAETTYEEPEKDTVVYHETFEKGKGVATQSGNASLTHVTDVYFEGNEDGAALYVSNRTQNWDAADFHFGDLGLEDGKTYYITVTGYVYMGEEVPENHRLFFRPLIAMGGLQGLILKLVKPLHWLQNLLSIPVATEPFVSRVMTKAQLFLSI